MFPPRSAPLTASVWLAGAALAMAQSPAALERSPWSDLADATPRLWGGILIAIILTAALLAQLLFLLRKALANPPALIDALERAVAAGNYQEAWEACNRWRQTTLGRILLPALERIGQGRDAVAARLAEESRRKSTHASLQLWSLLGGAILVVVLCLAAISATWRSVGQGALSPDAPRLAALAAGNIALLAALAAAVAVPVGVTWFWLRARARRLLQSAEAQARQLVEMLPYEEIEGVRIGRDFHAGTILGDADSLGQTGRLQVSKELTTQCPACNGPINPTRSACPHCGQLLSWS